MNKSSVFALRILMVIFAIGVATYALVYFRFEKMSLMFSKSEALLQDMLWKTMFYAHIGFGAIALAIGSFQFFPNFRNKFLNLHKKIGIIYVFAVFLSGIAGLYIAFFATTGAFAGLGFGFLAVLWLYTDWKAYQTIKNRQITQHQIFMIRNYALTLAAVTLRIYLGIFVGWQQIPFNEAYPFIAWGCWIPNLIIAEVVIKSSFSKIYLIK
jgi:uncharacterized membrane protein